MKNHHCLRKNLGTQVQMMDSPASQVSLPESNDGWSMVLSDDYHVGMVVTGMISRLKTQVSTMNIPPNPPTDFLHIHPSSNPQGARSTPRHWRPSISTGAWNVWNDSADWPGTADRNTRQGTVAERCCGFSNGCTGQVLCFSVAGHFIFQPKCQKIFFLNSIHVFSQLVARLG